MQSGLRSGRARGRCKRWGTTGPRSVIAADTKSHKPRRSCYLHPNIAASNAQKVSADVQKAVTVWKPWASGTRTWRTARARSTERQLLARYSAAVRCHASMPDARAELEHDMSEPCEHHKGACTGPAYAYRCLRKYTSTVAGNQPCALDLCASRLLKPSPRAALKMLNYRNDTRLGHESGMAYLPGAAAWSGWPRWAGWRRRCCHPLPARRPACPVPRLAEGQTPATAPELT